MYRIAESLSKVLGIEFIECEELSDESLLNSFDKQNCEKITPWNYGKVGFQKNIWKGKTGRYTTEHRKNLSFKSSNAFKSKEAREKHANTIRGEGNPCYATRWMNKGDAHKRVPYPDINIWKEKGWLEGRLINRNAKGNFAKCNSN